MKKSGKKLLGLLLALTLIVTSVFIANAAGTNLTVEFDKTTADKGETITLTMSNKAMTVSSIGGGICFDQTKLKALTIEGTYGKNKKVALFNEDDEVYVTATACSTVEEANATGRIGFAYAGTDDAPFSAGTLFTATFEVIAGGKVTVTMFEDSAGTDGCKDDAAATQELTLTAPKDALTGTVTVTGDAVIGQTLTADASALNDSTNVTYQWNRGGSAIAGATGTTYVLTADDYTKKITVTVTATDESEFAGSVTSAETAAVDKKDAPAAPALTAADLNVYEITVEVKAPNSAWQYACVAKGASVTDADFAKNLTKFTTVALTEYDVYARVKETADTKASDVSKVTVKTNDHSKGSIFQSDATSHWIICTDCDAPIDSTKEAHTWDLTDKTRLKAAATCHTYAVYYKVCSKCYYVSTTETFEDVAAGYDTTKHEWQPTYLSDGTQHWQKCQFCDATTLGEEHTTTAGWQSNGEGHYHVCDVCGAEFDKTAHTPGSTYEKDAAGHWTNCSECGYALTDAKETHTWDLTNKTQPKDAATCHTYAVYYKVCSKCYYVSTTETFEDVAAGYDTSKHAWKTEYEADDYGHWQECQYCDATTAVEDHSTTKAGWLFGDDYHYHVCDVCGEEFDQLDHSFTVQDDSQLKTAGTCTDKAVYYKTCECGAVGTDTYEGEKDPTNHADYGKTLKNDKPATCTEDGYTGDYCCDGCGGTLTEGEVIKAGHTEGNDWKFDKTDHWKECAVEGCGTVIDGTKAPHTFENKVCTVCGAKAEEEAPDTGDGTLAVVLVIAALLMACAAAVVVINKKDFE